MSASQQNQQSAALRAIAVLEAVARVEATLSLTEITAASGLPKPTAYRIVLMLEQAGMLTREPESKRYAPGPRFAKLALDALTNSVWRGPRHAILQALTNEIGETCTPPRSPCTRRPRA